MAQLRIRGVRSYAPDRDICFDLSSKVTLIYGQNGSGKSTVSGNDSNLLIVFYVQIVPDDFVMQLHRF